MSNDNTKIDQAARAAPRVSTLERWEPFSQKLLALVNETAQAAGVPPAVLVAQLSILQASFISTLMADELHGFAVEECTRILKASMQVLDAPATAH